MTSAPSHASIWVHDVPASNWVRSRMRIPFSAVLMVFLPYRDHTAGGVRLDMPSRRTHPVGRERLWQAVAPDHDPALDQPQHRRGLSPGKRLRERPHAGLAEPDEDDGARARPLRA